MFVKYFLPSDRKKLSVMVYIWIANGAIPFTAVLVLNNSHLVKDHLALDFLIDVFKAWRQEKGVNSLYSAIKKSNIESHLTSFIPDTKQSQLYFRNAFQVIHSKIRLLYIRIWTKCLLFLLISLFFCMLKINSNQTSYLRRI